MDGLIWMRVGMMRIVKVMPMEDIGPPLGSDRAALTMERKSITTNVYPMGFRENRNRTRSINEVQTNSCID